MRSSLSVGVSRPRLLGYSGRTTAVGGGQTKEDRFFKFSAKQIRACAAGDEKRVWWMGIFRHAAPDTLSKVIHRRAQLWFGSAPFEIRVRPAEAGTPNPERRG